MIRIEILRYDNYLLVIGSLCSVVNSYLPHLTWTVEAHCFNWVAATAQQATATRKPALKPPSAYTNFSTTQATAHQVIMTN